MGWGKEYNMMITIIVFAILGIACAVIAGQLCNQGGANAGPLAHWFAQNSTSTQQTVTYSALTLPDLQFLIFFAWLLGGIALGVWKH